MSWPKSVLIVGALLIFIGVPVLGESASMKLAAGMITLWFLIGPGMKHAQAFALKLGM